MSEEENTPSPQKRMKVKLNTAPADKTSKKAEVIQNKKEEHAYESAHSDFKPVGYGMNSKKNSSGAFILWSVIGLLLVSGIVLLGVWLFTSGMPKIELPFLSTETPTVTVTPSPTATATSTNTPTPTNTDEPTVTPTPDAPFEYVIQDGDNLWTLVNETFAGEFGENGFLKLLELNPDLADGALYAGQTILIPNAGFIPATLTPLPNYYSGQIIEYIVRPGDILANIASRYNTTVDNITADNDLPDPNLVPIGTILKIRANLVTPTLTPNPTITPGPSPTNPSPFTATPAQ